MSLNLTQNVHNNKHIVIHEFGHALGLEHEHQRSMFWSIAVEHIDVNKMRNDITERFMYDYCEQTQEGDETPEYDPDSIMHYW